MEHKPPKELSLVGDVAENWELFKQQFQIYLVAKEYENKSENVKIAMLLNAAGPEGVRLYNTYFKTSVFETDKESSLTLSSVLEQFDKCLSPKRNIVFTRYKFFKRSQEEGEDFNNFQTCLKQLGSQCQFGDQLDSLIRDRIVIGVIDNSLQERLLAQGDLSLDKAIQICQAYEESKKELQVIQGGQQLCVLKENKINHKCFKFDCKNCGKLHGKNQCMAYGKVCYECGKLHHFKIMCRAKLPKAKQNFKKVHEVDINLEYSEDNIDSILRIEEIEHQIFKSGKQKWIHTVMFEDIGNINFKLDSGADINVLPYNIFKNMQSYNKELILKPTNHKLTAYGGFELEVLGDIHIMCRPSGRESTLIKFTVVKGDSTPILGRDTCVELALIKRLHEVNSNTELVLKYSNEKTQKYLET